MRALWSFLLSLLKRCLSVPSREVQLFVFSDNWTDAGVRIVNSGTFPITLLCMVAENKTKEEVLEEWHNLVLETGKKKEVYLDLQEKIFSEICHLYVVSAENKKFYLPRNERLKIKQAILELQRKNR